MPAEWHPHKRSWMEWPCREEIWPNGLNTACESYARVAREICRFEPVAMLARPEQVAEASRLCGSGVEVVAADINDSWARDTGPTFLLDAKGTLAIADWRFNGYGGKFHPFDKDDEVASLIAGYAQARSYRAPFVLEGGAIHTDGEGTVLTTEQCVLNSNRNSGMSKGTLSRNLCDYLGTKEVVFLPYGLPDDWDTDGHVDNVAAFAAPGKLVVLDTEDQHDSNYRSLKGNIDFLQQMKDAKGRTFEITRISQPSRIDGPERRLCLSYLNYYPVNGGILCPQFGDANDLKAISILQSVFPDRKIVGVPSLEIVKGGGGIHCITQQEPAAQGGSLTSQMIGSKQTLG
jgi:agmatine deiminase